MQIHIHRHRSTDAWEEGKHPRKDDGKFGSGSKVDQAQAEHAKETGRAMSRGQAAAKVASEGGEKRKPLREQVKASERMKPHYTEHKDSKGRTVYKLMHKGQHVGTVASKREASNWYLDHGGREDDERRGERAAPSKD